MPLNPFFNQVSCETEQNLIQDLIEESIKIFGHEVYYLRRDVINLDKILGEDDLQYFKDVWPIEAYIKTHTSFQGQSEFVSKFGLIIEDRMDISLSVRRFHATVPNMLRPREGDLIWIQMSPVCRYLFDIRFVENQEQLFQLGKLYTYELRCERIPFSHEEIKTANTIINTAGERDAYTIDVILDHGTGIFTHGETVYQGESLDAATATGTVLDFTPSVYLLSLQNITGTFANGLPIIGVTTGAIWTTAATPVTTPETHDPIADNADLDLEKDEVIVVRGSNPRYN